MRILVTGGAGYIGGTVVRMLLAGGDRVTIYDNLSHSKRAAVAAGAEFVEGDVADRALMEKTLRDGRFDGVMHFAALIEAGESMEKPEIYFRNNTAGTLTLLEAMLAAGQAGWCSARRRRATASRRGRRSWRTRGWRRPTLTARAS